jgi:uncharacterized protein YbjT (DUF2867 family)
MGKVAIVLGATGVVGIKLVELLSKSDGIEVIKSITRRPVKYEHPKIVNHVVNFEKLTDSAHLFSGDILFSCLGTTRNAAGSLQQQRRVDVSYQLEVARLASNNSLGHYLLVSSSGANRWSASPYLKMKGELEFEIDKLPFQRISIFRPSLLLGERADRRVGETIGRVVLPVICKLPLLKKYRPITGLEVARKMVATSLNLGQRRELFTLDEIFN